MQMKAQITSTSHHDIQNQPSSLYVNISQFSVGHVTVYCSQGMSMFTLFIEQHNYYGNSCYPSNQSWQIYDCSTITSLWLTSMKLLSSICLSQLRQNIGGTKIYLATACKFQLTTALKRLLGIQQKAKWHCYSFNRHKIDSYLLIRKMQNSAVTSTHFCVVKVLFVLFCHTY